MTNQEVVDRLQDAIRDVQMVVNPQGEVTIYCEDKQNEMPGKKYLFHITFDIQHWKTFFESAPPPEVPK